MYWYFHEITSVMRETHFLKLVKFIKFDNKEMAHKLGLFILVLTL